MLKRLPLLIAVVALAVWLGNFVVNNFFATSLIAYGDTEASRDAAVKAVDEIGALADKLPGNANPNPEVE